MSYHTVSLIIKSYSPEQAGYKIQSYEEFGEVYMTDIPRIGESMSFNGKRYVVENINHRGNLIEENGMKFLTLKKSLVLNEKEPIRY